MSDGEHFELGSQARKLIDIGIALSSEKDIDKLLELILSEVMNLTHADAGTLYILENGALHFRIAHNSTLGTKMGGATGQPVTIPPVKLVKENVSASVAMTGECVNIPDVYDAKGYDFTGAKKYDAQMGYRSKSMLVVPMKDHKGYVIGVVQLINCKNRNTGEAVPFHQEMLPLVTAIASQAAVAIENDKMVRQLESLFDIGTALSAEKNIDKLLEMILTQVRGYTNADAGTLYILENGALHFRIAHNDTLGTRLGGTTGKPVTLPPVPLVRENVSANVAMTGQWVNIPDVYNADGFDFTGPKRYDAQTGYRSKSMLVVPMRDHEGSVTGVLQLINAKDRYSGETIPFSEEIVPIVLSLASQAAVAIDNVSMIHELEQLFESFVKVMAAGIDARSPYTAGHIKRVAALTLALAKAVNDEKDGRYAAMNFTPEQLNEIRIAGWLHDVGKVATPEHVMDKATKLQTIYDRVELVTARFNMIIQMKRSEFLIRKTELLSSGDVAGAEAVEKELQAFVAEMDAERDFVVKCNSPGEFLPDDKIERLKAIAAKTYSLNGETYPFLSENELYNLSIRKGSITEEERQIMNDHAVVTQRMLEKIPFPEKLKHVPGYAAGHHEKINGKGYPLGLKGDEISIQSRILAIADFFEALTANDRPYKKAMPIEKALAIMIDEANRDHLDKELLDLFIREKCFEDRYNAELRAFEEHDKSLGLAGGGNGSGNNVAAQQVAQPAPQTLQPQQSQIQPTPAQPNQAKVS